MSLTALATEILTAAKVIDESLLDHSKESHIWSATTCNSKPNCKASFIKRFSKRSHRVASALKKCLLIRKFRCNPAPDERCLVGTSSTNSSEFTEFCQSEDLERYNQLPQSLDHSRNTLVKKCHQIRTLIEAPEGALTNIYTNWIELVSLQAACHFSIFEAVPLTGHATYAEIAAASGVPEDNVVRCVRICILNGIFTEPFPGQVCHTPRSRVLLTHGPGLHDLIALNFIELAPAAFHYTGVIERFGAAEEPEQSPFALANNNLPIFQVLDRDPIRRIRFGRSMQYLTSAETYDVSHVLVGYDWPNIDTPGARALDVGGGLGQVSAFLAARTNNLHFTVQDLPPVVDDALNNQSTIPTNIRHRLSYLPQSFFVPHPSSSSPYDVVFLRWILHNWSDKYVRQIFRALIPALRKGSRVFIMDYLLDEKCIGVDTTRSMGLRFDMMMFVGFGAKERTATGIRTLIDDVAQEFGGHWCGWNVKTLEASALSFIEVIWDGD
ncbi:hypothetical protein K3495_g929 [Podosphaera aphanis]|nr:hypothetical protein K3495_g929 [Podosphaera aphanis]